MRLIGLSRATRQVLGLPDYVLVESDSVAARAWTLAGLDQPGSTALDLGDAASVDLVVGIVEAVEDFIVSSIDTPHWPADVELRAEAEAVGWVDDFLADGSFATPSFSGAFADVPPEV